MSKVVAIEGIDGAGKATQAKRLAEALQGRLFSFPDYSSDSGKILREHLVGAWSSARPSSQVIVATGAPGIQLTVTGDGLLASDPKLDMFIRQSLMTINRYEAMSEIRRAREEGRHIVFDRWWLSSLAYGIAEGVDRDWIIQVSRSLLQPDLWIYIDVPGAVGGGRRQARDNNERDIPKLERVRQTYLSEVTNIRNELNEPGPDQTRDLFSDGRAVIIDGTQDVDTVTGLINEAVGRHLGHQTFWKWS